MYCLICTHKIAECICLSHPEADAKIALQAAEIARLQAEVERLNDFIKHIGRVGGKMHADTIELAKSERDTAWNDAIEAAAQCTGNLFIRGTIRALRKDQTNG